MNFSRAIKVSIGMIGMMAFMSMKMDDVEYLKNCLDLPSRLDSL